MVKCSNFLGDALDIAASLGFEQVLLAAHIGKLVKVAGGIMQTHSRYADCRTELFCAHAAVCGGGPSLCRSLLDAATTDACLALLDGPASSDPPGGGCVPGRRGHIFQRIRRVRRNRSGKGDHRDMETRKGIFYGVGVGPGDPELLTVKALRTLERCPVIAAPQTKSGEMLALDIVRRAAALEGKTILPLFFTMARDKSQQRAAHETAADAIAAHLTAGRDVAMLNLGDVSIYATFGYIMDILRERGYEAVMIPGVPSFCAAAARLGLSLVSGETPLHIVPAGDPASLELPGTKVLMKAGKRLPQVREALTARGLLEQAAMVEDCGLPTEKLYSSMGDVPEAAGYFATVIVKEP